ncbi:MAG: hypothetical protein ACOC9B_07540 [Chloroflexota bacterium]
MRRGRVDGVVFIDLVGGSQYGIAGNGPGDETKISYSDHYSNLRLNNGQGAGTSLTAA